MFGRSKARLRRRCVPSIPTQFSSLTRTELGFRWISQYVRLVSRFLGCTAHLFGSYDGTLLERSWRVILNTTLPAHVLVINTFLQRHATLLSNPCFGSTGLSPPEHVTPRFLFITGWHHYERSKQIRMGKNEVMDRKRCSFHWLSYHSPNIAFHDAPKHPCMSCDIKQASQPQTKEHVFSQELELVRFGEPNSLHASPDDNAPPRESDTWCQKGKEECVP